jgi:hypothetical protein
LKESFSTLTSITHLGHTGMTWPQDPCPGTNVIQLLEHYLQIEKLASFCVI